MATGRNAGLDYPFKAAGDLSDGMYKGVIISANDTVNYPDAAAEIIGVLQNKPAAANREATVRIAGQTKVKAGGTLAVNDPISVAASGWFTKCASGGRKCGRCIVSAASGYVGEAIIGFSGAYAATSLEGAAT